MPAELLPVHHQRLRRAVETAMDGGQVKFRVNKGEPSTVVWWEEDTPRIQHVIVSGWGGMQCWLEAVESDFQMLIAQRDNAA